MGFHDDDEFALKKGVQRSGMKHAFHKRIKRKEIIMTEFHFL